MDVKKNVIQGQSLTQGQFYAEAIFRFFVEGKN